MTGYNENYLLDRQVKIFQPLEGYHASSDAVLLASAVSKVKRCDTILDVGSGTGAISLCLASRFQNQDITIKGIELQPQLASLANMSAQANGFDFVEFINRDIADSPLPKCSFAHVISNPPYGEKDMASPKESKSTAHNFSTVPNLGEWIRFCIKMLKPQGHFYMINRAEALDSILYHIYGKLGAIQVVPLISKVGQDAKRVIVVARKDSKARLKLLSPLIVHQEDGSYTKEAEKILRQGSDIFAL